MNSLSSDLDFLLAARKTKNGFNLVLSALVAKHTLTIHYSCPVAFQQIDFAPCLSIAVLDTMSFQTDVSSITIILEGGYLYLTESLRACKIHRIRLSIQDLVAPLLFYNVAKNHYEAWNCWPTHCSPQKEISHFHYIHFYKSISSWPWQVSLRHTVQWISCHKSMSY